MESSRTSREDRERRIETMRASFLDELKDHTQKLDPQHPGDGLFRNWLVAVEAALELKFKRARENHEFDLEIIAGDMARYRITLHDWRRSRGLE